MGTDPNILFIAGAHDAMGYLLRNHLDVVLHVGVIGSGLALALLLIPAVIRR